MKFREFTPAERAEQLDEVILQLAQLEVQLRGLSVNDTRRQLVSVIEELEGDLHEARVDAGLA